MKFENVCLILEGVDFAKDYQKDSYNKIIFIEFFNKKNILAKLKKHS